MINLTHSHYSNLDRLLDEVSSILNQYNNLLGAALETSETQKSASTSEATGSPRTQGNSRDSINV